jgi:hypothetical protein
MDDAEAADQRILQIHGVGCRCPRPVSSFEYCNFTTTDGHDQQAAAKKKRA